MFLPFCTAARTRAYSLAVNPSEDARQRIEPVTSSILGRILHRRSHSAVLGLVGGPNQCASDLSDKRDEKTDADDDEDDREDLAAVGDRHEVPVADSRNRGDTEVERVEPVPTLDRGVEERSGKKCRGNKHHGRPEARLTPGPPKRSREPDCGDPEGNHVAPRFDVGGQSGKGECGWKGEGFPGHCRDTGVFCPPRHRVGRRHARPFDAPWRGIQFGLDHIGPVPVPSHKHRLRDGTPQ